MQPVNSTMIIESTDKSTSNSALLSLAAAKGIIYAIVDKTPRVHPRRKKLISAPPRRKEKPIRAPPRQKKSSSKCNSVSSKLASSPTTIPVINEQGSKKPLVVNERKSRKPAIPYPFRNRWKSEDIYLPSNFRKEHISDLYRPFLPQKSGRKAFFTLPNKTKYINNDLTKIEILKNYWQQSSVSKECSFRNQLCIEKENEYDLQRSHPEIDLSSKLDSEQQSSVYYSSISSQSQNDASSYITLYSEEVLDSDLQSENDHKESLENGCQKSQFSVSDISNVVNGIPTLEKSDVSKNFDELMDEISLSEKSHITKSYESFDFNNLIEILDVPEILCAKPIKISMTDKDDNNTTIFNWNKIKTVDLTVKCSEFVNNISEPGSLYAQSIQNSATCCCGDLDNESHILNNCFGSDRIDLELKTSESLHSLSIPYSVADNSSDSERKKSNAFADNLNSLDATNYNAKHSESVHGQSIIDSVTLYNNLEKRHEPHIVNSYMISLGSTDSSEKNSEILSTQSAEGAVACCSSNAEERKKLPALDSNLSSSNVIQYNNRTSESLQSQLVTVICKNDPEDGLEIQAFDDDLSSVDTTDFNVDISWKVSELWDTMGNNKITDKLIGNSEYVGCQNSVNRQPMPLTSIDKTKHFNLLNFEPNLENCIKNVQKGKTGSQSQLADEIFIKANNDLFTERKNTEPQIMDNVPANFMKGENILNGGGLNLEAPQNFSKNEHQIDLSFTQIIQNSSSEVSLHSDLEKWQLAKPNNSSSTFASSSHNTTLRDALQETTCPFDKFAPLKAKMDSSKNMFSDLTQLQCQNLSPVSRLEQFERSLMPSSPLGLFKTSKTPRQLLKPFLVNLCIEGHHFHLDPFPFEIYPNMTLLMLKMKVNSELAIKTCQQRWILGNVFADDDDATLLSYGVFPGSYVFLYVDSNSKDPNFTLVESAKNDIKTVETEFQALMLNHLASVKMKSEQSERKAKESKKNDFVHGAAKEAASQNTKRCVVSKDSLLSLRSRVKKNQSMTVAEPKVPYLSNSTDLRQRKKKIHKDAVSKCESTLPVLPEEDKSKIVACSESHGALNSHEKIPKQNSQQACSLPATVEYKNLPEHTSDNIALDLKRYNGLPTERKIELHSTPKLEISKQEIIKHSSLQEGVKPEKDLIERRQNYERFLELESIDLVPNPSAFECPICLCSISECQGAILRDCLHTFCKDCLSSVIVHACESTIKCPYRDNTYSCSMPLQQREIKAVVSAEVYEQYLQRSLTAAESLAEKSFHCKNPDCTGWCLIEDNVNIFHCPVCSHYNCLTCQAIHEGLNCRQYQDNLKQQAVTDKDAEETLKLLARMVRDGQAMKCPKCCVVLMKKWGCDWLKCSICQTEVCWITKGPRWGPEGRGDITAGCKCGVDGKKCHPSCTYCH